MLNRTTCDGDLRCAIPAVSRVNQNVGSRWTVRSHVSLQVTSGDMDVTNISLARYNASSLVVTDVAPGDIGLMQVDVVVENANSVVLIDMTIRDDDIAVIADQVNTVV